jgi:hypothetical protein
MKHEERMCLAEHISERIVDEHPSDTIISGVYGSTGQGTDTQWSDLEMLFIVRSGSTIQGAQFLYRGTVVWLVVIEQDALEHQLITPDFGGWRYWMGILSSTMVLYGDPGYLQTLLRMGQSVPATKFREALEESLSWIVHEQFGRIKSGAVRRNSYDIGNAVVEVLADMRDAQCLLNQRWTTHSHKAYQGLVDTFDFKKLPEGYREIIPLLLAPQKDIDQTVLLATTLVENFWELLVREGIELPTDYQMLEDLPL